MPNLKHKDMTAHELHTPKVHRLRNMPRKLGRYSGTRARPVPDIPQLHLSCLEVNYLGHTDLMKLHTWVLCSYENTVKITRNTQCFAEVALGERELNPYLFCCLQLQEF